MSLRGGFEEEREGGSPEAPVSLEGRRTLGLLFFAVFGAFLGQTILFPILPPLGRELGLSEFQVGLLISVAAVLVVLSSPVWGGRSDAWGRKPVLISGMFGAALSLFAFAFVAQLGLAGALSVPALFALMLLMRGVLFGATLSAVPVAAQAYVADITSGERERTRGIAAIQAAQGLNLIVGPALGGVLAGIGLLVPLYFAPALVLIAAVLLLFLLPRPRRRAERGPSGRLSPLDARLWPFLVVGFGLFLSLGLLNITVGFLFQDRLDLTAQQTAQAVGFALFAAGFAVLFAQGFLVPRLGWPPLRLMRSGVPLAAAGMALLVFADGFALMTVSLVVLGLGLGLAAPGYTAAPTLLVARNEQGGVAGIIAATNALTFVFGPAIGTALYGLRPEYPYVFAAVLLALLFVFVLLHPGVRQVAREG